MPKSKDPTKPKGRVSAYAFFMKNFREEFKVTHPGTPVVFKEFSQQCAQRWKAIDAVEKKQYTDMAEVDKERYLEEMKYYIPPVGKELDGMKKKTRSQPKKKKTVVYDDDHDQAQQQQTVRGEGGRKQANNEWPPNDYVVGFAEDSDEEEYEGNDSGVE